MTSAPAQPLLRSWLCLLVAVVFLLQPSCSRKQSDSTPAAATNPPPATNTAVQPPVPTNPPALTTATAETTPPEKPVAKGIAEVEPVAVPKPSIPPPYHKVFALCIGINTNPAYGNLRFAVRDASNIASTFQDVYGFTNVTLLANTDATRANIFAQLDDIRERLSPTTNDDFIFYFSGHGDTWAEPTVQNGKTNITRRGFIVAYHDATNAPQTLAELQQRNIEITALASNIIRLPARHRLIFLDSCFSGLAYMNQPVIEKHPDDFNPELINHPTVQIMTAGLASEQALEDSHEEHGIFTAALLKQLSNDNILTMEEIFFPLRVAVRKSLQQVQGSHTMTPQLRYLIYENGSFLFVPLDLLPTWAGEKSESNTSIADADTKGYLRPVSVAEATNVQASATNTPEERQADLDRYEARAAMGDPCATVALAQIYNGGAGVPPDPDRAKLYTAESSDFLSAGNTLNNAALSALTNAALRTIVGGLLGHYQTTDLFHFSKSELAMNQMGVLTSPGVIKAVSTGLGAVGGFVGGVFGQNPLKKLVTAQKKISDLLANPTPKNITAAKKALLSCEDDLAKLETRLPPNQLPPDFVQIKTLVHSTEIDLDQNLLDQARHDIAQVPASLDALQSTLKAKPAGTPP